MLCCARMHLRLTEDELATLVEMVSLATEVANTNQNEGSARDFSRFEDVENKVLASAKHAGLGDCIEFDPTRGKHRVTEEFQEDSFFQEALDEFRNNIFWEELVIRLAERDLIREFGEKKWLAMGEEEQRAAAQGTEQRYWKKFITNGMQNLHWIHAPNEG